MLLGSVRSSYLKTRDATHINSSYVEYAAQEWAYKAATGIGNLTNEIWIVDKPVQQPDGNYLF